MPAWTTSVTNWGRVRGKRCGVMLHYDDSTSDASGIHWLTRDPRCHVSYNFAVRDNGVVVEVAPEEARAYHAGVCHPSDPQLAYTDANSAFYGVAVTAKAGDVVSEAQFAGILTLCRRLFQKNGWPFTDAWRITSHSREAWPRGRKVDCEGQGATPVLDPKRVQRQLDPLTAPISIR